MKIRQQGLSLVEMMIAMVLGLVLTLAVIQIFIASKHTYTVVAGQSQTSENGRVAAMLLRGAIQKAGYWNVWENTTITSSASTPVSRTFPAITSAAMANSVIIKGQNDDTADPDVLSGTDTLTVRYNGASDGSVENCVGQSVDSDKVAVDHYFIQVPAAGTEPELVCQSTLMNYLKDQVISSSNTQPLLEGIENLQLLYGIGNGSAVSQYLTANQVTDWTQVRSVKFAILAASTQDTGGMQNKRTYQLLDTQVSENGGDRRVRQVYSETVALRNGLAD